MTSQQDTHKQLLTNAKDWNIRVIAVADIKVIITLFLINGN